MSRHAIQLYLVLPVLLLGWAALECHRQLLVRGHKIGCAGKVIATAGLQRTIVGLEQLNTAVWCAVEFTKPQHDHTWSDWRGRLPHPRRGDIRVYRPDRPRCMGAVPHAGLAAVPARHQTGVGR